MSSPKSPKDTEQSLVETFSHREESPEELFAIFYQELRQLARAYMRKERLDHTIQATALVNETYLRLFEGEPPQWKNRKHLFCTVARTMRRILVDHGRAHHAEKRGGAHQKVTLDEQGPALIQDLPQLLALDQALGRLFNLNARQAEVVDLHSFVGLSEEETAEVLGISVRTVKNEWRFAKAWLKLEMGGLDQPGATRPD